MGYGDTARRARVRAMVAAALIVAPAFPAPGSASETALAARALPPALTLEESALRGFPASAVLVERGLCLEWAEPTIVRSPAPETIQRNRGSAVIGNRWRAALSADQDSWNAVLASPRGWGASLGYEASMVGEEERGRNSNFFNDSDETETAQRFEAGVGWRGGAGRTYEVGISGALFYQRLIESDSTLYGLSDDEPFVDLHRTESRHDEVGLGVTARSLSAGAGPQVAFSLYLERPRAGRGEIPELDQFLREARLDGAWRVTATGLDDLLVGVSLSWTDQAIRESTEEDGAPFREEENRETVYAGFAFFSAEKSIGSHVVVRAGARAPARIGKTTRRWTRLDSSGTHGPIKGTKEAVGSVQEPEVAAGLGLRWRRFHLDAQVKDSIRLRDPVSRWSLTILL